MDKPKNNKKDLNKKKRKIIIKTRVFLTDSFEFDVENERAIRGYIVAHLATTIAHVGRYGDLPLAAHSHVLHAHVPALDHVAFAQLKLKRLAARARVELLAVLFQSTRVVHVNELAFFRLWSFTFLSHLTSYFISTHSLDSN